MAAPVDSAPWKRMSWRSKYSKQSSGVSTPLPTPTEGQPLENYTPSPVASSPTASNEDPVPQAPTPKRRTSSTNSILTLSQLDDQASQLILNALERTHSQQQKEKEKEKDSRSSFGKLSFGTMMGGLSSLSLSRSSNSSGSNLAGLVSPDDASRGRSLSKDKKLRSSSAAPPETEESSRSRSRARSQSPFTFRKFGKSREPSPPPVSLAVSDAELSDAPPSSSIRPRNAFSIGDNSDSDEDTALETEEDSWSEDDDFFDPITERNTEQNAVVEPINAAAMDADVDVDPDPLGEGVNVVVPPEPYFPTSVHALGNANRNNKRGPRRRKTIRPDPLPLDTSRPVFKRDRCTITIAQGDPDSKLENRKRKRYVIASDLSEESRYAVEWGIGTVLRDGDEMLIVTVNENESKVDPPIPNAADRAAKLRSQQERQGLAYILLRQATSLLQRTKLHVRIACQAWHAKNARHMILDIVDYYEPTMLIVGSRGLGQLKGILLGSTSHYLIQKCSVPVMVARRRLKRPPRRSAHLAKNRTHVKLAEAGIDRMAAKVDQDVEVMRQEVERDDKRREGEMDRAAEEAEDEEDEEGIKVPG